MENETNAIIARQEKHLTLSPTCYTLGIYGRPVDELHNWIVCLDSLVIDIRHNPISAQFPDWNKSNLEFLYENKYKHLDVFTDDCRGRPAPIVSATRQAVALIENIIQRGKSVVLLCHCKNYNKCNRASLASQIADDIPVKHLDVTDTPNNYRANISTGAVRNVTKRKVEHVIAKRFRQHQHIFFIDWLKNDTGTDEQINRIAFYFSDISWADDASTYRTSSRFWHTKHHSKMSLFNFAEIIMHRADFTLDATIKAQELQHDLYVVFDKYVKLNDKKNKQKPKYKPARASR